MLEYTIGGLIRQIRKMTLLDSQIAILAECGDSAIITSSVYRQAATILAQDDRKRLIQWVTDTGIEILPAWSLTALYHHQPGRKYRPSKRELSSGKFECPDCRVFLVKITRRAQDPLFRCPSCAWCISRSDIFEPEMGEVPDLRTDTEYPEGIVFDPDDEATPW
jgi:hypothetical protein